VGSSVHLITDAHPTPLDHAHTSCTIGCAPSAAPYRRNLLDAAAAPLRITQNGWPWNSTGARVTELARVVAKVDTDADEGRPLRHHRQ
jgi:hypothetical protein